MLFEFNAPLMFDLAVDDGYMKHYVPVPADVATHLADAPRLRGRVGGHAFRRVMHRRGDGEHCLKFGAGWLKTRGLMVGDVLAVEVSIDPEPDRVDVPEALEDALLAAPDAALRWDLLTPGKQRTLVYAIERAKRPETKARRALKVIESLRTSD